MSLALFDILTEDPASYPGDPARATLESVQRHLQRLLNARRGSLAYLPEYGLPDLGVVYENLPYSVEDLAHQVSRLIEHFEPRLSAVRVRPLAALDDDRRIRLEIVAQLTTLGEARFQTVFECAGSAEVRARTAGGRHA
ncbi:type VI secretion system baseplate subunit TssE [Geoalkalibacter halelectricus]|uniref:Type VI secretion system baseplate subunit TssE n=1 Tax=Geoalkalibacter halelectricus TaxID=2847045 RepID=A0ABY5ZPS3_9BACT|nr:type VI secretion system baseplate subunit TssE [Geoalkalibacter halelectricus]MDO3379326.1 type VI secretion system baseplate subunit TssE [Geoalkalibacter halelectricus]UWZ81078.1 type VI secretion system baseplate subunit TssE [Geoalkalibacter halelectricus]